MKRELEHQYEIWQDIIESRAANLHSWHELYVVAETNTKDFENKIKLARINLIIDDHVLGNSYKLLMDELNQFKVEMNQKLDNFWDQLCQQINEILQRPNMLQNLANLYNLDNEQQQGLSFERIQQFEEFQADESYVGDQCVICMGDIKIGRNMLRLDCDGQHTFCHFCIERWFADHNTCPVCRHKF